MAKASFHKMGIKIDNRVNKFTFENVEVEVKQYLPISDKYDLIMVALQKAEENGIYNDILLDAFFHLNIVYLYTNISFTENQKADEMQLFDLIESSGLLGLVVENMEVGEYNSLLAYLDNIKTDILTYRNTAGAVLQSVIQDLPKNAQAAKDIIDNFDKDKFKEVIDFATAANGNRDIVTNKPVIVE